MNIKVNNMSENFNNKVEEISNNSNEKKLYWKMYQDKNSINGSSVIITQEEMIREVNYINQEYGEDEDFPVFEPVYMTEELFNNLPEFGGF